MVHPCLLSDVYVVVILQPQIVERYFSECSDSVKLVNVTLRSALLLVRVSILRLIINFSHLLYVIYKKWYRNKFTGVLITVFLLVSGDVLIKSYNQQ